MDAHRRRQDSRKGVTNTKGAHCLGKTFGRELRITYIQQGRGSRGVHLHPWGVELDSMSVIRSHLSAACQASGV